MFTDGEYPAVIPHSLPQLVDAEPPPRGERSGHRLLLPVGRRRLLLFFSWGRGVGKGVGREVGKEVGKEVGIFLTPGGTFITVLFFTLE